MVQVKICGLRDPDTVRHADAAGADWIGFVFVEKSPRFVTPDAARSLLLGIRHAVPVALTANPDDALLAQIMDTGISVIQLHGNETPERAAEIKAQTGAEIWRAFGVRGEEDVQRAADFPVDRLLFDAPPPDGATRTGGHGEIFDWTALSSYSFARPWLLAGGLTPQNVDDAIKVTRAPAVDVSSGVERAPGLKDPEKITAFIDAAKGNT